MSHFDEFGLITKMTQGEFIHILESIPGNKELVVHECLMRPLDKIASMSFLHEHDCLRVQRLHLDKSIYWSREIDHRVFLVRPTIAVARKVCELIKSEPTFRYSVILVDRKRIFFSNEFERNGLFGIVNFYEFNLSLISIESDLFSLELPSSSFKVCYYEAYNMAKALWQLQSLYGLIPTTFCIGNASQEVDKHYKNISNEQGEPSPTAEQPISHMFLFDRSVDLVSVFLTCLTYESMLNDMFQYSCGKINFGEAVNAKLKEKNKTDNRIFVLNNSDAIFSAIRNAHMAAVFPYLSAKAKELQASFDRVSGLKKVEEMKTFVSNDLMALREQNRQLEMHICACEAILSLTKNVNERFSLEYLIVQNQADLAQVYKCIEKFVNQRVDPWSVLQLVCLWSVCNDRIPQKYYKGFQALFLKTYGYMFLPVFYQLQSHGLLTMRPNTTIPVMQSIVPGSKNSRLQRDVSIPCARRKSLISNSFPSICSALKLCPVYNENPISMRSKILPTEKSSSGDKDEKQHSSYVFSNAYVPIICRLIEMTISDGWDEVKLKRIFGESIPLYCTNPTATKPDNRIRKAIIVAFVGGITFAEVAALRLFAQNNDFRLIIITTSIIRRTDFLKSISEL